MTQSYAMPKGYRVIQLHDYMPTFQRKSLEQDFGLLELNYPGFAANEDQAVWQNRLHVEGTIKDGDTDLLLTNIVGNKGIEAFAAVERYRNGTALISYTCSNPANPNYENLLWAAKHNVERAVEALMAEGVQIKGLVQEHAIGNPKHEPKYEAGVELGQYPLSNPSLRSLGIEPFTDYLIPVTLADVKDSAEDYLKLMGVAAPTPEQIMAEIRNPAVVEVAMEVAIKANLFLSSVLPNEPVSYRKFLEEFALGYGFNNSYHAAIGDDIRKDPGVRSILNYAKTLPYEITLQQVHEVAGRNVEAALAVPRVAKTPIGASPSRPAGAPPAETTPAP